MVQLYPRYDKQLSLSYCVAASHIMSKHTASRYSMVSRKYDAALTVPADNADHTVSPDSRSGTRSIAS